MRRRNEWQTMENQVYEDIALRLNRLENLVLLQALLINKISAMTPETLSREDLQRYHDWLEQLAGE